MIRIFCDRCGSETDEGDSVQVLIEYTADVSENDQFDLCHDCQSALVEWFSAPPLEDKRTAAKIFNLESIIRDGKAES